MVVRQSEYKYQGVCQRCGGNFAYYRNTKDSSLGHKPTKYCEACRLIVRQENANARKATWDYKLDRYGYAWIRQNGKTVHEHSYVMEQMLGRPLKRGESVHHKNGLRADNRPDNLELWVSSQPFGQRASDLICPHCGKPYSSV